MRNKFIGMSSSFVGVMFLLLVCVSLLLAWRVETKIDSYNLYQTHLAQKQARVSAQAISTLLQSIRERMIAVALDEFFLTDLRQFNQRADIQGMLTKRLKYYFPEMYSFGLFNVDGKLIGGDLDFSMGEVCQSETQDMAKSLKNKESNLEYYPHIHASPGMFHFDMMFPVYVDKQPLVFFMSFKASLLHDVLLQQKVSANDVYMLSNLPKGLIEVSYDGVRDQLKRSYYLTAEEQAAVLATLPVPHSRWDIAVVANSAIFNEFKHQQMTDAILIFFGFFVLWLVIFILGYRTENKKSLLLEKLDFTSNHDFLTGTANRRLLVERLEAVTKDLSAFGVFSGLLLIDLNSFKPVNDEYGHETGDQILKIVGKRLTQCCRENDLVARLGGDEFVVLFSDLGQDESKAYYRLSEASQRCYDKLCRPYEVNGLELDLTASVGLLLISSAEMTVDEILKEADESMYQTKRKMKL